MGGKKYHIASCSCGKDSLAMVLRIIEEEKPLDEIVFYDTGMEFMAIYTNWMLLKQHAQARGIKCVRLTPSSNFEYSMTERIVNAGKENEHKGYSWCGGKCRWGTTEKLKALDKYCEERNAVCYVGIAVDETERLSKERKAYKKFPLAEWAMTEADCLAFCRARNVNWLERSPKTATGSVDLYDILDRVSCWCCGNKNLWELRNIWYYLPEYWERLKRLQAKLERPFKKACSIFDLEQKFKVGYSPKHREKRRTDMDREEKIRTVARLVGEVCEMHNGTSCVEGNDCANCSIATEPAKKIYDVFSSTAEGKKEESA